MTRAERIRRLKQQAARSDEMAETHRRCLATAFQLRANGGYTSAEKADEAIRRGANLVVQMRQAAAAARAELASLRASATA